MSFGTILLTPNIVAELVRLFPWQIGAQELALEVELGEEDKAVALTAISMMKNDQSEVYKSCIRT